MNVQFKKGVLELCVLSLLKGKDRYGYEMAEMVSKKIVIAEGTLYPLLRRLSKEGYCETYLSEQSGGPARKYYRLTPKGIETQQKLKSEWLEFTASVEDLIGG